MAEQNGEEFEVYRSLMEPFKKESKIIQSPKHRKSDVLSLWCSTRLSIAIIGFFGYVNLYAMRVNMSMAMVCMVNHTAVRQHANYPTNTSVRMSKCLQDDVENQTLNLKVGHMDGTFDWPKPIQGQILSSFFWGYLITQLPGGWMALRFGAKHVMGWSMFLCSVATLLMPLGAHLHYGALMALRIIAGMGQGVVWPATYVLWSRWAPPLERSQLIGYTNAGAQIGNVITLPLSGFLCAYGFGGGWPSIFYVLGMCGIIWFIAWMFIVYDSPGEHPRISEKEREYVETSLEGQMAGQPLNVPWLDILKSGPVWAIFISQFCSAFAIYTFLTNTPTYLREVLKLDVKSNGVLSAVPYISLWVIIVFSSWFADLLLTKKYLTIIWCRKIFTSVGMLGPAVAILGLSYVQCSQTVLAIVLLILGICLSGPIYGAGLGVNPADIAPTYSGIIFGLSNTMATVTGFVAPTVIGFLTKNQLQSEWQNVFYICVAVYIIGAIAFVSLSSGSVQSWAITSGKKKGPLDFDHMEAIEVL